MVTVLPVKFKYSTYDLWFDPQETGACAGDHVVVSTERGCELGLVTRDAFEVPESELGETIGESELRPVLRIANELDLERADALADKGDEALPVFKRLVNKAGLEMKPVGVEYLFGGERVVCYFSADDRVDFRALVRDLSHELQERIDMRQIGVREEAAIVGGYAHCGQELCCTRFGGKFEPVSIRMAKEQDLPLNSSKISGACGRLMCCLRYEFEAYRDFKSRAPKKNAVIDTPLGKAKIVEYDTPKEQICMRLENGKQIRVPLAEMEASPAACKKSKELGCACRPDTVLRSTLDKILTPDIQMALAELDRKHGILPPEESLEGDDMFAAEGHATRASRSERSDRSERSERAGRGSRSHGKPQASGSARASSDAAANDSAADKSEAPKLRRRRARHAAEGTDAAQATDQLSTGRDDAQGEGAQHRRRRHHKSGEAGSERPQRTNQSRAASEDETGSKPRRRTRRPGDRGGQTADKGNADPRARRSRGAAGGQPKRNEGGSGQQTHRRRRRPGSGTQPAGE